MTSSCVFLEICVSALSNQRQAVAVLVQWLKDIRAMISVVFFFVVFCFPVSLSLSPWTARSLQWLLSLHSVSGRRTGAMGEGRRQRHLYCENEMFAAAPSRGRLVPRPTPARESEITRLFYLRRGSG